MKINAAVRSLTSLAHPSRLEAFRLLVKSGPLCAGELAGTLGLPGPTLSFHLKELSRSGLIDSERQGRSISYGISVGAFRELMSFLLEDCCQGKPELCLNETRSRAQSELCC